MAHRPLEACEYSSSGRRLARRGAARGRVVAVEPLHHAPAPVQAAPGPGGGADGPIDLLVPVLADVADPQVAVGAVEREPPRVPEAALPDLVEAGPADVRVGRGDRVVAGRGGAVDVDPQHLAEQGGRALGAVAWVAAGSAVAHADVQVAVAPEGEHPAVVVRVRLADRDDRPARARGHPVGVRWLRPGTRGRPWCRCGPCSSRRTCGWSCRTGGRRGRGGPARCPSRRRC